MTLVMMLEVGFQPLSIVRLSPGEVGLSRQHRLVQHGTVNQRGNVGFDAQMVHKIWIGTEGADGSARGTIVEIATFGRHGMAVLDAGAPEAPLILWKFSVHDIARYRARGVHGVILAKRFIIRRQRALLRNAGIAVNFTSTFSESGDAGDRAEGRAAPAGMGCI